MAERWLQKEALHGAAHCALMAHPGHTSSREVSRSAHKVQCHAEGAFLLHLVTLVLQVRHGLAVEWREILEDEVRRSCGAMSARSCPQIMNEIRDRPGKREKEQNMIDPPKKAEQQDTPPDTSLIGVYNQGVSDMVFI